MIRCRSDERAAVARTRHLNGIDGIDVSADQLTLTVLLFGKSPVGLTPANFRIDGGRRITGIRVTEVAPCTDVDPEISDCLTLTVDRPGDFSEYCLCIVEPGEGRGPLAGFDPRYACMPFSFKQNCSALTDCADPARCPPPAYAEPEIDYLAKDYASFLRLAYDRLSLTIPQWSERHVPDIGVALVELLAATGDELSYLQDATATEAYLDTARLRVSVRRHARLVEYPMHDGCAARAWVCVQTDADVTLDADDVRFAALPADLRAAVGPAVLEADLRSHNPAWYEVFEPIVDGDVALFASHDAISLWSWGGSECCLPSGTTSATLVDGAAVDTRANAERVLQLHAGDVLILQEIRGATTGLPADADRTHVHPVRLTAVTPGFDALYGQPVLEVSWAAEDALPFDLCVTARCGPQCAEQEIAVARGNVVLVDHGRTLDWCTTPPERHTLPPARTGTPRCCGCEDGCCPDEPVDGPPYPPERGTVALRVDTPGVTQVAPFPRPADQARAQARVLAGIPDRARARLTAMLGDQPPTGDDLSYLRVLFGGSVPPQPAVLLNEFDHLLSVKLARLRQLVRRARAGHVLDESDAWEIGWSWGTAEQQAVDPAANGLFGPAAAARVVDPATALPAIRIIGLDGAGPWLPARDLLDAAPGDRLFVGEVDDAEVLTARFGATAPGPGSTVQVGYRAGNGTAGNVGAGAINTVVLCTTRQDSITGATNPLAAFGGTDPEPVERVRQLAPYEPTHRLRRAITAADYAELAGRVPGVQRAAASLRWLGSWYEMQVAVDALGSDVAPEPLLDAVRDALHPYRRIGHDLSVRTARLVPLDLALAVQVQAGRITARVRTAVRAALLAYLAPDNLTFGQSIRVSRLIALAAGVPGVRHVEVTRLQPLFGPGGSALADGLLALGVLEIAQLDDDPIRPENGRLVLTMAGGR